MTTAPEIDGDIETQIAHWRRELNRAGCLEPATVDELETHLRDQIDALTEVGLDPTEAFLVGVKRIGNLDALARELAHERYQRLWKQLVLGADTAGAGAPGIGVPPSRQIVLMVTCALAAAAAIKVPALFGADLEDDGPFYARNLSLFAFPFLALYLGWQRRLSTAIAGSLAGLFALGAVAANVYPFRGDSSNTQIITALHLPIVLWFVVAVAYLGADWARRSRWMDMVRFTGELALYWVLIGLGGGVLMAFSALMFNAIGLDPETLIGGWLLPCGAVGAVVVAAWLVEAKQDIIENLAPVLTRLFTPLFVLVMVAFLVSTAATGTGIGADAIERDVLIGFDLLLVVVVGLQLYAASARDPSAPPGLFDLLQLALAVAALAIDVLVLSAVASRIGEFGWSPNKVAALGENLVLAVSLAGTAWLSLRFWLRRCPYATVERWQTGYLPVYALWALVAAVALPPIFDYR